MHNVYKSIQIISQHWVKKSGYCPQPKRYCIVPVHLTASAAVIAREDHQYYLCYGYVMCIWCNCYGQGLHEGGEEVDYSNEVSLRGIKSALCIYTTDKNNPMGIGG